MGIWYVTVTHRPSEFDHGIRWGLHHGCFGWWYWIWVASDVSCNVVIRVVVLPPDPLAVFAPFQKIDRDIGPIPCCRIIYPRSTGLGFGIRNTTLAPWFPIGGM